MARNVDSPYVNEFNGMFEQEIWSHWEDMEAKVADLYGETLKKIHSLYRSMAPFNVLRKTFLQARAAYYNLRGEGMSQQDAWQEASGSLADFANSEMSAEDIELEDHPVGRNLEAYKRLANWRSRSDVYQGPRLFESLYHAYL